MAIPSGGISIRRLGARPRTKRSSPCFESDGLGMLSAAWAQVTSARVARSNLNIWRSLYQRREWGNKTGNLVQCHKCSTSEIVLRHERAPSPLYEERGSQRRPRWSFIPLRGVCGDWIQGAVKTCGKRDFVGFACAAMEGRGGATPSEVSSAGARTGAMFSRAGWPRTGAEAGWQSGTVVPFSTAEVAGAEELSS